MEDSKIEWTDHTFNIAWGCTKVDDSCKNCYAESLSRRYGHAVWGRGGDRWIFGSKHWSAPLRWNLAAVCEGVRRRVFCSSMCDVFEDHPIIDNEREKLWPLIRTTPMLDWQLLTKRPERVTANLPGDWKDGWNNVLVGVSVGYQEMVDLRLPTLMDIPVKRRFVSYEPALERVNLRLDQFPVDWVIVGGESGGRARPFDLRWAEDAIEQCRKAGVPCFVKQLGCKVYSGGTRVRLGSYKGNVPEEWPEHIRVRQFPGLPARS